MSVVLTELLERCQEGEHEAIVTLVTRFRAWALDFAASLLHDPSLAEDVVQEAFLIAYKNLCRLRNPSSYASWIAAITKNVCRGFRRQNKSQTVSLDYLNEVGVEPSNEDKNQNSKKEY